MHLQPVDQEHRNLYKVWLEARGKRVFVPAGDIPAKVRKKLEAEVTRRRASIEAKWTKVMLDQGWLTCEVRGTLIVLTAYPHTPNRFERYVECTDAMSAELAARFRPPDVRLNFEFAALEFFPNRPEDERPWLSLPEIIWQD
jgi:hypothetical protein